MPEESKQFWDDDHPRILTTMDNLVTTYWVQGRTREAVRIYEGVVPREEQADPRRRPSPLITMDHHAETYRASGEDGGCGRDYMRNEKICFLIY